MNSVAHVGQPVRGSRPDAPLGWGAAVIDDQGNEIPITESMVTRACDELSRTWTFPRVTLIPNQTR